MGLKPSTNLKDTYAKKHLLGRGSFATVYLYTRRNDKKDFAVKILQKKSLTDEDSSKIKEEIKIMQSTDHPNIVRLIDVYESKTKIQIVLELCTGGHLLERLGERQSYCEAEAAKIIKQLASACKHMHSVGVVHRDLKPENILYASAESDVIKVTDFGLSAHVSNAWEETLMTPCGTPAYVAPEVIKRKGYHAECDLWSVGVILYLLVSGYPPFYGSNLKKLLRRVSKAEYDYKPAPFEHVTDQARDVIDNLLVLDTTKRWTPDDLLKNAWVNGLNASTDDLPLDVLNGIRQEHLRRKARKCIHYFATARHFYEKAKSFEENVEPKGVSMASGELVKLSAQVVKQAEE